MEPFDWSPFLAAAEESPEPAHQRWYDAGICDGLPLVPPTAARVRRMYREAGLEPVLPVATIEPALRVATVYDLAVCAVAAGCEPAALPVVVAAVRAVADPSFNLLGIQSTTGTATPALIVHGPVAERAAVSGGGDCLAGSVRANATIGRALRLALRALGGAVPGVMDAATMGQPAKLGLCFAENRAASPWLPLHVELGLRGEQSAVTAVGISGSVEIVVSDGDAEELLQTLAWSALSPGNIGSSGLVGGGSPLFVLSPEHAQALAAAGIQRRDAQYALHHLAQLHLDQLPTGAAARLRARRAAIGEDPEAPLRLARGPGDILVVVAGGIGVKSTYLASWGGGTRAVTVPL